MALPNPSVVKAAIESLYQAFAADKTAQGSRAAVSALNELRWHLNYLYQIKTVVVVDAADDVIAGLLNNDAGLVALIKDDLTVTDTGDADLAAFYVSGGELYAGLGNVNAAVGDVFKVAGTGDTTDNALEAAKGSAVANEDVFIVTNIVTEALVYLGVAAALPTGAVALALGRPAVVGDTFVVGGTPDTTDNALEAAKGSAVASGDVFGVQSNDLVTYLGSNSLAFDFSGETAQDFNS